MQNNKCMILRDLMESVNNKGNIGMQISNCPYRANCGGTCPSCNEEVIELTNNLNKRNVKIILCILVLISILTFVGINYVVEKNSQETVNEETGFVLDLGE